MIIDGRAVPVEPGATILDAAHRVGIAVPTLCHHASLPPDGSCRMCLVEIDGWDGLHPACTFPAATGMVVRTESDATRSARRNALRLLLRDYRPGPGKPGNELLEMAARYGLEGSRSTAPPSWPIDDSNPFIRVDRNACIRCWRCVRACDLLNGVRAIGVFGRDQEAHIGFGFDGTMQDSTCEFCGMCEAVCPTDALTIKPFVPGHPPRIERGASTVCPYCGVGCRLDLHLADGRIVGTSPEWRSPANQGLLCVKGRFGWSYVHDRERLTRPRVRRSLLGGEGTDLVETDWDTALDLVARTLLEIESRHGADALGFLASAKCSNEENYLFQKLARS
jgi:predicted molibdopterin-dependent oxidoreductase YjgC